MYKIACVTSIMNTGTTGGAKRILWDSVKGLAIYSCKRVKALAEAHLKQMYELHMQEEYLQQQLEYLEEEEPNAKQRLH